MGLPDAAFWTVPKTAPCQQPAPRHRRRRSPLHCRSAATGRHWRWQAVPSCPGWSCADETAPHQLTMQQTAKHFGDCEYNTKRTTRSRKAEAIAVAPQCHWWPLCVPPHLMAATQQHTKKPRSIMHVNAKARWCAQLEQAPVGGSNVHAGLALMQA